MPYQYLFTVSLVVKLLCLTALLLAFVWFWALFLNKNEHDPDRVRTAMLQLLLLITTVDVGLYLCGVTRAWVVGLSIVVNVWGGLDATLRFPAAHKMPSFFTVKQVTLLFCKTVAFAFGMHSFWGHIGTLAAEVVLNTLALPISFWMAAPLDPREQVARDDAHNVDLAIGVWRCFAHPEVRRCFVGRCRLWWCRRLNAVLEGSLLARWLVCAVSPEHRRAFGSSGRRI
mmetsp:Transcript_11370/g.34264  ORF Transcript_11370/g.34264 Transcript_11370/m.34264 type:complete len:228 (-) Transcript_11370:72-755(-)